MQNDITKANQPKKLEGLMFLFTVAVYNNGVGK